MCWDFGQSGPREQDKTRAGGKGPSVKDLSYLSVDICAAFGENSLVRDFEFLTRVMLKLTKYLQQYY